jgi:hypothetical protein
MSAMSHGGVPGLGWQSNQSGQLRSCSHPQPQAFPNIVVFSGQTKSMVAHWSGLLPT